MRKGMLPLLLAVSCANAQNYTITTVAGGPPTIATTQPAQNYAASFINAGAVDSAGNLYAVMSDLCQVWVTNSSGTVTQVIGTGNCGFGGDLGPAASAQLNGPLGAAVDSAGNLYIADTLNNRIRKVVLSTGVITTVAGNGNIYFNGDGTATSASLFNPSDVAVDTMGNLYIADTLNNRIRELSGGNINTIAGNGNYGPIGNGTATLATMAYPRGVAVDSNGNVYIADTGNGAVRMVTTSAGTISTLATSLNNPNGVAVDSMGNVYVADTNNNVIRKISGTNVSLYAGNFTNGYFCDGCGPLNAELSLPQKVSVDSAFNVYIADTGNSRLRKVVNGGIISTVVGDGLSDNLTGGTATSVQIVGPQFAAKDSSGNLYISDLSCNVYKVTSGTNAVSLFAGSNACGYGGDNISATATQLNKPAGIAVDSAGNVYIADSGNNRIREVSGGTITTVAGNGTFGYNSDNIPATNAWLEFPVAVALDSSNNLYIADKDSNRIREVSGGMITTVAGSGGYGYNGNNIPASSAELVNPEGVAVDSSGNIYIADTGNHIVRKVSGGFISTVAGTPQASGSSSAYLNSPASVAVDSAGNIYIADTNNQRIQKVTGSTVSTIAGTEAFGYNGDNPAAGSTATSANLNYPNGVSLDSSGDVYVADTNNNRIRELTGSTQPPSPTIAKAFSPATIQSGGTSVVTLTLSNSNASSLSGGAFTDTLVNMNAAGGAVAGTCSGITPSSLTAGATALSFTGITIPASGSCTVAFSVTSNSAGVQPNTTSGVSTTLTPAAGAVSNTATLTVLASSVLSIMKSHSGNFAQGQSGATYTVIVSNGSTAGPTSGTVTVTETVPAGMTLVSMAGTGWTCPGGGTTCTRSDVLAAGASYPAITVTVNVAANASSSITNSVAVSGGGSATANWNDPTTITVLPSVYIDTPSAGAVLSGTVAISGWAIENTSVVGPNKINTVTVFVDGSQVGTATYGTVRSDVCSLWPGRQGCPNVGWTYNLNTALFAAGSHVLNIVATDSAGITGSSQVSFQTTAVLPSVLIDVPTANATLSGVAAISGWAIENTSVVGPNKINTVTVFVDGGQVGTATYGGARSDVCALWPGRQGCPNVGWNYNLNTASFAAGSHTLNIVATDSAGNAGSAQVTFKTTVLPTVWIDVPAANAMLSGMVAIGGWAIENTSVVGPNKINSVAVFVDGSQVGTATYGSSRSDVCSLWPGRLGCPNVGWSYTLNTALFAAGSHTLNIAATDSAGNTGMQQVTFQTQTSMNQTPSVWIDAPAANATLNGMATINGWAIENTSVVGPNAISSVAVFVDGNRVGTATYGSSRSDVCALWPGRLGCPNVGWTYTLNTALFAAGSHALNIVATDSAGNIGSAQVTFQTPLSPSVWIDAPTANQTLSGTATISGWAIESTSAVGPNAISNVAVFVDGNQVGTATYGTPRSDVCGLWPGRLGCPNVGWTYSLNTSSLASGSHTLNIVATDSAGITGAMQVAFSK